MSGLPHLFLPESMTKTVEFPEPDHCTCDITQGTWSLETDDGAFALHHDVCGKPLLHDLVETVTQDKPFTVTLTPEVDNCQCRGTCDCTVWLTMKTVPGTPQGA